VAHKHRARELLDRALQTRRDRKDTEANHQRRQRQRAVLEQLCNKCFSKEMQDDPGPGERFWKRHAFSARSRHRVEDGADAARGVRYSGKHEVRTTRLHREVIDRAPAHTDDSIRAVLRGGSELDTSSTQASKPFIEIEGSEGVAVNFDWSEPYVMAYNSASAGIQRQDKWCMHGELSRSMPIAKVRTRPGHDETELKMMNSAAVMESLAGGGVGVATKILSLGERGARWDHINQFAAMAQATAFEMPKEMALELVQCLADAAVEAEAEQAEAQAVESLRTCAMSLLASAAARARDADSLDFPLCGLEMIAKTGLGWSAFSNMFLVAVFVQLQRCHQETQLQMSLEAAGRVSNVFVWAADCHGDLVGKLAPAGRRVAGAAHRTLSKVNGQGTEDSMLAKLVLLAAAVVAVARAGAEQPWQFVLAPGEAVVLGRAADCDVVLQSRGVSGRHAVLRHRRVNEDTSEMCLEDTSTNGTGLASGSEWQPVRKGDSKALGQYSQILLPFNCKVHDQAVVLTVSNFGPGLPDAYDSRHKTGRWRYRGKLGEGALGVVHQAIDITGKLKGDVAIKVCKVTKGAKPTAKLRSAFILHREAQWSLQRLHNSSYKGFSEKKAALFARYLEDHTGRWSRDMDFDAERATFEAPEFRWDKFRPPETLPPHPYVAMEFVPGRTLHAALGWSRDQPVRREALLSQEEKQIVVRQAAEALVYLVDMGLIHRDFRTTNLMVSERKAGIRIHVIDLGHTILAESNQSRNKSAVVRCNWKEEEKKRFDWAPPEVKAKENFVNFAYPTHSFDVYSFGVLAVQLQTSGMQAARLAVSRLMGLEAGDRLSGALGLSQELLSRMLGDASKRPNAEQIVEHLRGKEPEVVKPKVPEQVNGSRHDVHVSAATLVEDKKQDGAANGKLDAKVASDNGIDVHDVHEDHPPKEEGAEKARRQQGGVVDDADIEEVVEGEMADDNDSNSSAEGKRETKETLRAQALQVPHAVPAVSPEQKAETAEPSLKRQADNHADEPAKKRREKKSKDSQTAQSEPDKTSDKIIGKERLETQASPQGQSAEADNRSMGPVGIAAGRAESAGESKRQLDPKMQPSPQRADAKRRKQDSSEHDQKAAELAAKAQDLRDAKRERIQEQILLRQLGAGERRPRENPSPDAKNKPQPTSGAAVEDGASSRVAAPMQEPRRIAFEVKNHQEAKKADRTSSVATEQNAANAVDAVSVQKQIGGEPELLGEPVLEVAQEEPRVAAPEPVGKKPDIKSQVSDNHQQLQSQMTAMYAWMQQQMSVLDNQAPKAEEDYLRTYALALQTQAQTANLVQNEALSDPLGWAGQILSNPFLLQAAPAPTPCKAFPGAPLPSHLQTLPTPATCATSLPVPAVPTSLPVPIAVAPVRQAPSIPVPPKAPQVIMPKPGFAATPPASAHLKKAALLAQIPCKSGDSARAAMLAQIPCKSRGPFAPSH
ncbi:unnamed protein product, partial [Symbiodinium sp. CCMP2456]